MRDSLFCIYHEQTCLERRERGAVDGTVGLVYFEHFERVRVEQLRELWARRHMMPRALALVSLDALMRSVRSRDSCRSLMAPVCAFSFDAFTSPV